MSQVFQEYVDPIHEAIDDLFLPTLFGQVEPLPGELRQLFTLTPAQGGLGIPDLRIDAPQQYAASTSITTSHVESIVTQRPFKTKGDVSTEDRKIYHQSLKTASVKARMETIDSSLSNELMRLVNQSRDKGASSWLNAIPLEEQGLAMNKQEFRDSLRLRSDQTTVEVHNKAIIGNDGAYSLIRREMSKQPWYNYKQEYIAHAYQELHIPAKDGGEYAMDHNFLHVWPRDSFMLIALPNKDGSFTCTLIMPCKMFESLKSEKDVLTFFNEHFQDTIPLMGEKHLVQKFFSFPPSPMVSVKCSPYHVKDKVIIMGDAAHAMVPFYGQGMNCAFEDCLIFNDYMDKYNDNFDEVFGKFTLTRCPDAHAICDLSYYNYVEMRALLNSRVFFVKTFLIKLLNRMMPRTFIPLYHMVAFSRTPYHEVVLQWKWQEKIVTRLSWICVSVPFIVATALTLRKILNHS
ncbi:kynurenine 3-monooxygenase [Paramuricea clavata]|uniref:Kynurenine 3-monooxygenase n=1 Tax=Paramuricea clavata TaxID=317549 RepID=A0A6S7K059_PARCT|nr:kynurenine 3-monooxygenase [Paramuricea clavata]